VGGTLDNPGIPWKPRFERLYREAGVLVPGLDEAFGRAFYESDDHLHERHDLAGLDLAATVQLQVEDTFRALGRTDPAAVARIADAFVADARASYRAAAPVLSELARSFRLGVISNFYGNLRDVLRHEGLLGFFQVVIDSTEVGLTKPDPGIFHAACNALGVAPGEVAHVGDSYPRDVMGARGAGLSAVWLAPDAPATPDAGVTRITCLEEIALAVGPVLIS
jgi:HAD superfamily hydrolase (TIGR01549 family)